jgi:hypothetical protein
MPTKIVDTLSPDDVETVTEQLLATGYTVRLYPPGQPEQPRPATPDEISELRRLIGKTEEIRVEDDALTKVDEVDGGGDTWVQAWIRL